MDNNGIVVSWTIISANIFITFEGNPKYYDKLEAFVKPHNIKNK
jgi:hypothetical protein